MKMIRSQLSVDTPIRGIAAALGVGLLYLAGLIVIHQLAG